LYYIDDISILTNFKQSLLDPRSVAAKSRFHRKTVVAMAHVLVIDDDWTVLSLASGILEAHGYLVSTAKDGCAGMKIFDQNRIDLVVTAVVMPGQEGMATIATIRCTNRTIPIPAMSDSRRYGGYLELLVAWSERHDRETVYRRWLDGGNRPAADSS
jgi:PleD family two-component response regulator